MSMPWYKLSRRAALAASFAVFVGCEHHGGGAPPGPRPTGSTTPTVNTALWVANGSDVIEFVPSQLTGGAIDPAPQRALQSAAFGAPQGVTFDTAGNLWVVDGGTVAQQGAAQPAVYEFTVAQLSSLGSNAKPAPAVTLQSGSFGFPQQAAFDRSGNLWVTDNKANSVFEFTASQLTAGGTTLAPTVVLTANPAFSGPLGIAFSPAGNLWIANNASTTLDEFNASALSAASGSVTLTPNVVLSNAGSSLQAPWGLAFDASSNLWASNTNAPSTVVEFAAAVLASSGSPTPAITIAPDAASSLAAPNGIAFDNLGDLAAVSSASPFGVAIYAKGEFDAISGTSALVPQTFVVGSQTTLNAPAGVAYGPEH